jgi:hypothetical protein
MDKRGPGDYLAVTATYDLFKLKMLPEIKHVFLNILGGWEWRAGDRILTNESGDTRVILRSANSPEGLESATAKAAWLDECGQDQFRLESWEAVQRRLSMNEGRVLGTTTPYNLGWLKSEIYDVWQDGNEDYQVIQFKSTMNPNFPPSEFDRAKDTLPLWKILMFYCGDFARYVGVDFGAVNTALVWIAEDVDKGAYYVYRDTLEGELTTKEHAARAKRHAEHERVISWAGGAKSEQQQRWDWRAEGVALQAPEVASVDAGIDRVIRLLKEKRLFVFSDCRGILDELGTYSRQLDSTGQPTEKIKDKDTFHRLDALRYNVQQFTDAKWTIH